MYYRRLTNQHPLATKTSGRIDIAVGGDQHQIIQDSFTLIRQSLPHLNAGEHVLYLNTLASPDKIAEVADRVCERTQAKVVTYSASGTKLMQKLEMLSNLIATKKVKLLVLGSIDLAVNGSRQKTRLVQWLREMRDGHDVRIIVYSIWKPSDTGAMAVLKWLSNTCENLGSWQQFALRECVNTNTALDQVMDSPEVEKVIEADEPLEREDGFTPLTVQELIAKTLLKTNDLTYASAHPEAEMEEELEEELELV